MDDFKTKFKNLRKSCGYTQEGFGEILGLKQQTVCGIEKGRKNPSKTVRKFIEYLYIDNKLFKNTPDTPGLAQNIKHTHSRVSDRKNRTGDILANFSDKKMARECIENLVEIERMGSNGLKEINYTIHTFLEGMRAQKKMAENS